MFYIKKLNLAPSVKASLFSGVRLLNSLVAGIDTGMNERVIWNARRGGDVYEATTSRFTPDSPIIRVKGQTRDLDEYFDRFKLVRYLARFFDTNWGYHRHVHHPENRYNLAIIDSPITSTARFWNSSIPGHNAEPTVDLDYSYLPPHTPGLALVHEEEILPYEVYAVSSWVWHSHSTPDEVWHSYLDLLAPGQVRVLTYLVHPLLGRNDQDIYDYIEWIESIR